MGSSEDRERRLRSISLSQYRLKTEILRRISVAGLRREALVSDLEALVDAVGRLSSMEPLLGLALARRVVGLQEAIDRIDGELVSLASAAMASGIREKRSQELAQLARRERERKAEMTELLEDLGIRSEGRSGNSV